MAQWVGTARTGRLDVELLQHLRRERQVRVCEKVVRPLRLGRSSGAREIA